MSFDTVSKIVYRIKHRIVATKASEVRLAFRVYSDPDDRKGWWFFVVRCFSLTHEVFLHNQLGQRYLTVPKALCGMVFFYLCRLFAGVDLGFEFHFSPTDPGGFKWPIDTAMKLLRDLAGAFQNWKATVAQLDEAIASITASVSKGISSGEPLPLMLGIYGLIVNVRLLEIFIYNRLNILRHPHSSGEPHFFWTPLYWISGVLRLRMDVVKQFGEPGLCWFIGSWIRHNPDMKDFVFIAAWLQLGAIFVALRVYLENRNKTRLYQEQIANQLNSSALQAQQKLLGSDEEKEFSTVRSNF